jgi:hypothetical protein
VVAALLLVGLVLLFWAVSRPGTPPAQDSQPGPGAGGERPGIDPRGRLAASLARPDTQISLPVMPNVGRLAVQTPPNVYAKYAFARGGAVVLILDCSGSMNTPVPGNSTRFRETTQALLQVLKGIPDGTQVSIWAFSHRFDLTTGRNMENDDPEKTIQEVYPAKKWKTDEETLASIEAKIKFLKPYNETPIVRSMVTAMRDFKPSHGFKTMVVLTDGMDNRFEPRGTYPGDRMINANGLSIPDYLMKTFGQEGIDIRIIGFRLPQGEKREFERQFKKPLASLKRPGKFYEIKDTEPLTKTLIEVLRESLPQRLFFSLEESSGTPVKGYGAGVDISRVGNNSVWVTLKPGYYWIDIDTKKELRQKVKIRQGDRILLNLYEKSDGFALERDLARASFPGRSVREVQVNDWLVTVLQNQLQMQTGLLQLMVTVENVRHREFTGEGTLGRVVPELILFQVQPRDASDAPPPSLRYYPLADLTAPSWGLEVKPWAGRKAKPVVEVFWSEDTPDIAGVLRRGRHFGDDLQLHLDGRGAVQVQLSKRERGEVRLLSMDVEKHMADTHDGKKQEVSCLVVRLGFPPGQPVMVQLPGFRGGQEHRFYSAAGKYTGIFWEMTPQQAQQQVQSLNLISLMGFREAALAAGQHTRIELPEPNNVPRPRTPQ